MRVPILTSIVLAAVAAGLVVLAVQRQQRPWKLSNAAMEGDLFTVERCVTAGVDINAEPQSEAGGGMPALIAAASGDHNDIVRFLLDHGADINRRDSTGNTALNHAAIHGNLPLVEFLLSRGADPNLPGEGYPLWNANNRGDPRMIELLKSHGAHE